MMELVPGRPAHEAGSAPREVRCHDFLNGLLPKILPAPHHEPVFVELPRYE